MEKSLSQLLLDAAIINRTYPLLPGICSAVICLNISGKPAKADEHVVSLGHCKSTKFMYTGGEQVCAVCWTHNAIVFGRGTCTHLAEPKGTISGTQFGKRQGKKGTTRISGHSTFLSVEK